MAVILCVGTNELSATSMQFITTEFFVTSYFMFVYTFIFRFEYV